MEREFLRWLRGRLPSDPRLVVPPGDDATVIRFAGRDVVATVDMLTEGVDFLLDQHDPRRIGRKALAVNLSDLAAMAARPVAALAAVALPRNGARPLAEALLAGMHPLAAEFGLSIAGGDTNTWDGPLVISITALGEPGPGGFLRRSGARPGDVLLATGSFGGSILSHQFDFTPRVREALLLAERYPLGGGIDVSDGLAIDALHLAEESNCGVELELERIPIAADALRLAEQDGIPPLDHALADGEDFELLLAAAADVAQRIVDDQPLGATPISEIGRFIEASGLWQSQNGRRTPLAPRGWEHRDAT